MKRFLVIQTAFLGDVILITPVISELKRIFPDARIDVLVRKGNESLLDNNPKINKVYTFDKKNGKVKSIFDLVKNFKEIGYDEIFNFQRFFSSGLITILSKGKRTIGFEKNPLSFFFTKKIEHKINNGEHEVERNLKLIAHHGAQSKLRPELFPSDMDYLKVRQFSAIVNYHTFSPASVWFTKQLPKEKWIELGKKISKEGIIYFIGGPNDKNLCQEIIDKIEAKNCINLAGELSLLQSAALIENAKMNYVNDSGPMHLASAMNANVTAFYCSTIPDFGFGPLSENSVIKEVNFPLECRPCGLHGYKECPKKHFKCGYEIEI